MHIFRNPNFDFVRWKWQAIALSWLVILSGVGYIWKSGGMAKSVEFSGGTIVIVRLDHQPNLDQIRGSLPGGGANAVVQSYGGPATNQVMIRVHTVGAESGSSLSSAADTVLESLNKSGVGQISGASCTPQRPVNCIASTRIVGPTVGKELEQRGILATVFALSGILVHSRSASGSASRSARSSPRSTTCSSRWRSAFFHYEMSLNVIAALRRLPAIR